MPFQFPDPAVSTRVQNPATGEWWVYANGVWQVEDVFPNPSPEPTPQPTPPPTPVPPTDPPTSTGDLEAEIAALRTEINLLQNDIIGLRADLASATSNNFLTLE